MTEKVGVPSGCSQRLCPTRSCKRRGRIEIIYIWSGAVWENMYILHKSTRLTVLKSMGISTGLGRGRLLITATDIVEFGKA
jgi:hypothetical protein